MAWLGRRPAERAGTALALPGYRGGDTVDWKRRGVGRRH